MFWVILKPDSQNSVANRHLRRRTRILCKFKKIYFQCKLINRKKKHIGTGFNLLY